MSKLVAPLPVSSPRPLPCSSLEGDLRGTELLLQSWAGITVFPHVPGGKLSGGLLEHQSINLSS